MREERLGQSSIPDEDAEPKLRDRFTETVAKLFKSAESEDDDVEEEDGIKSRRRKGASSRWRRFLRGMFSRTSEETDTESEPRQRSLFPFISFEKVQEDVSESSARTETSEKQSFIESSNEQAQASSLDIPDAASESTPLDTEVFVQPENSESTYFEEDAISEGEAATDSVETSEDLSVQKETEPEQGVLYIHHDDEPHQSRISAPEAADVPRRGAVDRTARGMALGFAGLEYIGRKRDTSKIRREQARQKEALQQTKADVNRQENEAIRQSQQVEQLRRDISQRNQEELTKLKQKRREGTPSASPNKVDHKKKQTEATPSVPEAEPRKYKAREKTPLSLTQEKAYPEAVPQKQGETTIGNRVEKEKYTDGNQLLTKELEKIPASEEIYETADEAAAHGVPVEKYYERRHEVKDEESDKGPVSIGAIIQSRNPLNDIPRSRPSVASATIPAYTNHGSGQQKFLSKEVLRGSEMYSSAIKSGFYTAIFLASALFLLYIL